MNKNIEKHVRVLAIYAKTEDEKRLVEKLEQFDLLELTGEELIAYEALRCAIAESVQQLIKQGTSQESADKALEIAKSLDEFEALSRISNIQKSNWKNYLILIENIKHEAKLDQRLKTISLIKDELAKGNKFSQLSKNARYMLGGNQTEETTAQYGVDIALFGSMKGAGQFVNLLNERPEVLDDTIASIPLAGAISKSDYLAIVEIYLKSLESAGITQSYFVPFTRLLTMVRPDFFFCLTGRNRDLLNQSLEIKALSSSDYERYWDDIIQKLHGFKFYSAAEPSNDFEKKIWSARTALLDMFFYESEEAIASLNHVRKLKKGNGRVNRSNQEAKQIMATYWREYKGDFSKDIQAKITTVREKLIELLMLGFGEKEVFACSMDLIAGTEIKLVIQKLEGT